MDTTDLQVLSSYLHGSETSGLRGRTQFRRVAVYPEGGRSFSIRFLGVGGCSGGVCGLQKCCPLRVSGTFGTRIKPSTTFKYDNVMGSNPRASHVRSEGWVGHSVSTTSCRGRTLVSTERLYGTRPPVFSDGKRSGPRGRNDMVRVYSPTYSVGVNVPRTLVLADNSDRDVLSLWLGAVT